MSWQRGLGGRLLVSEANHSLIKLVHKSRSKVNLGVKGQFGVKGQLCTSSLQALLIISVWVGTWPTRGVLLQERLCEYRALWILLSCSDTLCILSAFGTAVCIRSQQPLLSRKQTCTYVHSITHTHIHACMLIWLHACTCAHAYVHALFSPWCGVSMTSIIIGKEVVVYQFCHKEAKINMEHLAHVRYYFGA